jgi:hypothetical protein
MIRIPVNPDIEKRAQKYERTRILFQDDEQTLRDDNTYTYCFKLPHETQTEYNFRKNIFINGFINPTLELINAPGNVIFREAPKEEIPEDSLTHEFAENVLRSKGNKISLTRWMQDIASPMFRLNGTVFVVMDMPPDITTSLQDQKDRMVYPYINFINPGDVINWEMEIGEFSWFAYKTCSRLPWTDFTKAPPRMLKEIHVWDKVNLIIYRNGQQPEVKPHNFGFVPIIYQTSYPDSYNGVIGDCTFFTTAKLIFSAMNFLTCANIEVLKFSASLLLMAQQAVVAENSDIDNEGKITLKKHYDETTLIYGGDKPPQYLTKDLQSIPVARDQYRLYMAEAIENEKSNKSMGNKGVDGTDVMQSGIAKAIDRDPIEANIVSTATDCESLHKKILVMAAQMLEEKEDDISVEYEKKYDIKSFEDKLNNLKTIVTDIKGYPSITGKREMYKSITPGITEDPEIAKTINDEIDTADVSESIVNNAALEALISPGNGAGDTIPGKPPIVPPVKKGLPVVPDNNKSA